MRSDLIQSRDSYGAVVASGRINGINNRSLTVAALFMTDYTWPSVYFCYFFFAICLGVAVFFFIRSIRDGYWNRDSEEIKYVVFEEGNHGTDH